MIFMSPGINIDNGINKHMNLLIISDNPPHFTRGRHNRAGVVDPF